MSQIKNSLVLFMRLVLASVAMSIAYIVSTFFISSPEPTMTPEEASAAGMALFIVSAINALALSYPILRSGWHGLKLIGAVFLVQFGVETFLTQIESLYFNRALQITAGEMTGIISAGAIHRSYRYPPDVQAKVDRCRQAAERRLAEVHSRLAAEERDAQDHG